MTSFQPPIEFQQKTMRLLPFRFERLSRDKVLISNMVGEISSFSQVELEKLCALQIKPDDGLYERAFEMLLIADVHQPSQLQLLALRLRSRFEFLKHLSSLHIFVVTLRCEHSCPYCQVSRRSADKVKYDMSKETAEQALDFVFSSPTKQIKIEFQGGEPLLNFELIKFIVRSAEEKAELSRKVIQFVVASNLALLNDEILSFCGEHNILLSTSLDGPADLHNKNRPRQGKDSYSLAASGIRHAQKVLGKDRVGALMTTTAASLGRVEEIIDEYVSLDLEGVFLRPLSPYGFAIKTKQRSKYTFQQWLEFYKRGLDYILKINLEGRRFTEFYAKLLLKRLLSDEPTGYVDLRSPAGTGLGALVYNYDGKIFASDEGRMLAEMGDNTFELGHLRTATYEKIMTSDKLVEMIEVSLSQCAPQCTTCAFENQCGADPVFHHATQGDFVGAKPFSEFCARQKSILRHLIGILEDSREGAQILKSWAK